jgi:hypothetical protein
MFYGVDLLILTKAITCKYISQAFLSVINKKFKRYKGELNFQVQSPLITLYLLPLLPMRAYWWITRFYSSYEYYLWESRNSFFKTFRF